MARAGGRAGGHAGPTPQAAPPLRVPQRPGYLGLSLRDLDAAEAMRLHLHGTMGLLVVKVDRDAPGWTAGLRSDDILLEINGQPVSDMEAMRRQMRLTSAGDTLTLRVRRGSEEMSFAVTLGDQSEIAENALTHHLRGGVFAFADTPPAPAPAPAASTKGMASTLFDALIPGSLYTGLEVEPLTPQLATYFGSNGSTGLLVTGVAGASPAAVAGLAAGDVIIRAGNQQVKTSSNLAHAFREAKGNAVPLAILRDHREVNMSLQPVRRKKL